MHALSTIWTSQTSIARFMLLYLGADSTLFLKFNSCFRSTIAMVNTAQNSHAIVAMDFSSALLPCVLCEFLFLLIM